ncbi:putative transcription factor bHLH family [Helianthus annuus]|uniref:Putative basic helix-loop-helix (BHLH) DNA-binding superfamily protein n=1 Tax=Helianthus annuus TaxID=4232 RepID=A0A251S2W2_HELAN|nr:transcription factor bHLH111 [Helianthus annuus]KAF5762032.1 putative transcription factor bHLH family [Helianthus annuus]KAJ0439784.1 putative transcription factor bHLH family [Helianthus annuus]KAJ0444991.1 putative transcription factor bHLH family [Helianthus annuus]KAJ0462180.1 putative transcription factor bHLH family [Helianthus annuus]KAJ0642562.1 putative transcription factor bHLH family [Helianthus annuus]
MDNCIMAEQCNKNSIATSSSSAAKWWQDVHASSMCSWTGGANYASNPPCNNSQKPNSNSCSNGEEDVSISTSFTTNASNNSGLSMESSRRLVEKASTNDPYGEAVSDNHHLWNQVLLDAGTAGELQNIQTRMFDQPACDYLKKIDSGWEFSGPTNINQFQKIYDGFKDGMYQSKTPSTTNSWSIAPSEDEISPQFDQYIGQFTTIKNEHPDSNTRQDQLELFRRRLSGHAVDYEGGININQMVVGDNNNNKYYYNGMSDMVCSNGRGFVDLVTFGSCMNKPSSESNMSNRSMMNTMNLPDRRTPDLLNSYQPLRPRGNTLTKISGRGNGVVNEGKKKKSEDQSGPLLKKAKLETSTVSSTKVQIPKAKLGDKITALQQIVSPFGKTDTASVLWEAIGYIKCLQEQVQLLSNPYMKTNIIKDSWVRFETKDRGDLKLDLKSRGLCLVPVSCTPQVYHENNGSTDYWTPTYRGCFYR